MSTPDLTGALLAFENDAFERGREAGRADAAGGDQTTPLAQINRMGRQIEESHAALRRRGEEVKILEARIRTLEGKEADLERLRNRLTDFLTNEAIAGKLTVNQCRAILNVIEDVK